jgi:hypothetical protein
MNATRAVKDLSIGDRIQVNGLDGFLTVRSAKRIADRSLAPKMQCENGTPIP